MKKNSNFKIVVVIPAKTCPCAQISRVLKQLGSNYYLVVVANGKRVNRFQKCKNITIDSRVEWVIEERLLNAGKARNIGVKSLMSKKFKAILFCDADDLVDYNWVEQLSGPLQQRKADVVGGVLLYLVGEKANIVHPAVGFWHKQALFGGNLGMTYNAWKRLGGFDEKLKCSEDTDLSWRAKTLGLRVQVEYTAIVTVKARQIFDEFVQRFCWGLYSIPLLRKHSISFDHLPTFGQILYDKVESGFARQPTLSTIAQFGGQLWGRIIYGIK
jgi:glycosyltransferase involved in cell wall biosynthesis